MKSFRMDDGRCFVDPIDVDMVGTLWREVTNDNSEDYDSDSDSLDEDNPHSTVNKKADSMDWRAAINMKQAEAELPLFEFMQPPAYEEPVNLRDDASDDLEDATPTKHRPLMTAAKSTAKSKVSYSTSRKQTASKPTSSPTSSAACSSSSTQLVATVELQ
jgi:hypothetical protein